MGRPAAAPASRHLLALTALGLAIEPGILVGGSRTRRRSDGSLAAPPDTEPSISARAEGVPTLTQSPAEAEVAEEEALDQDDSPPAGPVGAGPAASLVAYSAPVPQAAPAPSLQVAYFAPAPRVASAPAPAPVAYPALSPLVAPAPVPAPALIDPWAPWPAPPLGPLPRPAPAPGPLPGPAPAPVPALAFPPAWAPSFGWVSAPLPMPVPGPAPLPAPVPAPMPAPAPAPANASSQDVTQTIKVNNVDYNKLISSPSLLASFEDALKTQIAAQSGHGVTPDDVDLALSPGSVVVEATVHVPSGSSASAVQAEACSSSASLGEDVTSALSNLPGMSAAATGAITSEVTADCGEAAGAAASPARRLGEVASTTQAVIVPSGDQDMDSCNPSCVAGQGVCSDKICFCRSPYTGLRCEREMQASYVRFTYAAAVGIALAAVFAGLALAVLAIKLVMPRTKLGSRPSSSSLQGETWTATEGGR